MGNETRVVHCKVEKYDVYIGRPSKWGNPFSHKDGTLARFKVESVKRAVEEFERQLRASPYMLSQLPELRGKVLGCWCGKGKPCHGRVIIKILEEMTDDQLLKSSISPESSSEA